MGDLSKPVVAVLAFLSLAGCAPHVTIQAPSRSASYGQREVAYRALRPIAVQHQHIISTDQNGITSQSVELDFITLANGALVHHPEDLLPVLREEHVAALEIDGYLSKRRASRIMYGVGIGIEAAGAIATLVPGLDSEKDISAIYPGLVVMGIGVLVTLVAQIVARVARNQRERAFHLYESGLRDYLGLGLPTAPNLYR